MWLIRKMINIYLYSTFSPRPGVVVVHLKGFLAHHVVEEALQVWVVGPLLKLQGSTVQQHLPELVGQVGAQFLQRDRQLFVHDLLVFLLLAVGFKVLPG
jgi:hypothetical protein